MTAVTRKQFVQHWNDIKPGLGDTDSNLWAYERDFGPVCQWFVSIKPIRVSTSYKDEFWEWCKAYCPSGVGCYSASDEEEWWGFVDRDEMVLWLLRWV